MQEIAIRRVFRAILAEVNLDPDTVTLTGAQRVRLANLVNFRLEEAWQAEFWPQVMQVEQRYYRPAWDAETTYAAGEEIYNATAAGAAAYWRSVQANNLNHDPATDDGTWWSQVDDDMVLSIDFYQDGQTWIDGADPRACIYDRDPRLYEGTEPMWHVEVLGEQILVRENPAPAVPWVRYRPLPPEFSYTAWSAATAYAVGDLVYLESSGSTTVGQTFKALRSSTNQNPYSQTAYWQPVDCPKFLEKWLTFAAAADWLKGNEQKEEKRALAYAELERLRSAKVTAQAVRRVRYRPPGM